ncbi:hypothetical protein C8R43DRAFT_1126377 [Mycena crocata]|nr:hypothetical protein C8R43DRAFT_1126377 [Mycena crocata]
MLDISSHIAQEHQHRVLDRLSSLCTPLLSDLVFDRDFFPRGERYTFAVDSGGSVDYVFRNRVTSCEPVIVGSVQSISQLGPGFGLAVKLRVPPYSSNRMDVFYWNQCATLAAIVDGDTHTHSKASEIERVVGCCTPPGHSDEGGIIDLFIPEYAYFRRCFPSNISIGSGAAALPSSDGSSCTLTDTGGEHGDSTTGKPRYMTPCYAIPSSDTSSCAMEEPDDDHVTSISVGHTLVSKCAISCRDYPRGSDSGTEAFVRVYTLTAIAVERVV